MAGSTRIKGKALLLTIGGTDQWADIMSAVLDSEEAEKDTVTFADAAEGGGQQFFFSISAIQSTDANSFWTYCWDHSGETVAFVFAPHGNNTATASQPHFKGNCVIAKKPTIGGEAGKTYAFETRFDIEGTPTKAITGTATTPPQQGG